MIELNPFMSQQAIEFEYKKFWCEIHNLETSYVEMEDIEPIIEQEVAERQKLT